MLSLYDYESYRYSIQLNPDDIGTVPTELATTQLDSPIHAGKKTITTGGKIYYMAITNKGQIL
jgi:hypothetical protein